VETESDPGIAAERARAEEFRSKYLLAAAEVENVKKRERRRSDDAARALKKRLLMRFLPVLDNLERAVAYEDSGDLRAGLDATLRGFAAALETEGVAPIETAGQRFDASVAEAVGTQLAPSVEDETVLAQVQRGYRVDDELLRPARVIVAKNA
jgi:molecular chaperone GrpE